MKRLIAPATAAATALVLSACGGGGGGGGASQAAAPAKSASALSVKQLPGVGQVLVDAQGKAVYTSDQEKSGKVVCDKACTSFWDPVGASGAAPKIANAGKLGVITRPDGKRQLTANGRPLYTFAEDSPGKAMGNGFKDVFAGRHFTWHIVRSGGRASTAPATSGGSGSSGYGGGYGSGY
jgi:predicted lipoprotein with Yx(FWY)xxD motif